MKMVISTSQNYFIELHRAWWRSREKSYMKNIWHSVGAEQKFIFTLLSLPPSFSFTSHLPLSLSSSPTLAAASAGLGVNRRWPKLWKLLSFYLTAAYCSSSPRQKWPPLSRGQRQWWCSLTAEPLLCPVDDPGCLLRSCGPGNIRMLAPTASLREGRKAPFSWSLQRKFLVRHILNVKRGTVASVVRSF